MTTLKDLAIDYNENKITDMQVTHLAKDIKIFEPIVSENDTEDGVYSIGDGNSWMEAQALMYNHEMSIDKFYKFVGLVEAAQK